MTAPKLLCPTCGQPIPNDANREALAIIEALRLTPRDRVIAKLLGERLGAWATKQQIIAQLYGGAIDGGPLTALRGLDVAICILRKALRGTSLSVETRWGVGWRMVVKAESRADLAA